MADNSSVTLRSIPLPKTREEMVALKTMKTMTLNDYVDQIHVALFGVHAEYTEFLRAAWPSEAKEGALDIDDTMAAMIIKNYAIDNKIAYVLDRNLATIRHALKIVLRRYHISRNERAVTVDGEQVMQLDDQSDAA